MQRKPEAVVGGEPRPYIVHTLELHLLTLKGPRLNCMFATFSLMFKQSIAEMVSVSVIGTINWKG